MPCYVNDACCFDNAIARADPGFFAGGGGGGGVGEHFELISKKKLESVPDRVS